MDHPKDLCPDCIVKDAQLRRMDRELTKARHERDRQQNRLRGVALVSHALAWVWRPLPTLEEE